MLAINIRNASSVIIPSSIIRNNLVFVSVDMYYIVYYQKGAVVVETVLKGGKVLEILQVKYSLCIHLILLLVHRILLYHENA